METLEPLLGQLTTIKWLLLVVAAFAVVAVTIFRELAFSRRSKAAGLEELLGTGRRQTIARYRIIRFAMPFPLRAPVLFLLLLPLAACSESTSSLAGAAVEAVALPFKVHLDSKSYPGPESVTLASESANGTRVTLSCILARPLTGSFWGGHGYYEAAFYYEVESGGVETIAHYWPTAKSEFRKVEDARPLCRSHHAALVPRDGGFEILVDMKPAAFIANDGGIDLPPAQQ